MMSDSKKPMITVITPTYNRAHSLPGLYKSLLSQTDRLFTWMVIDDGSDDNTEEVVKKWIGQNEIRITYYKKTNGGKCSALNLAFARIETEYCTILDSDDAFAPGAIELALKELSEISTNNRYAGILALRTVPGTEVPMGGKALPVGLAELRPADLENKYHINSETIVFYKSFVVNRYRYPRIPREQFFPDYYLNIELGFKYFFKASKGIFCYCEYLNDGITKNIKKIIAANPKGYTMIEKLRYEQSYHPLIIFKSGLMYICGLILSKGKITKKTPRPVLTFVLLPFGWLLWLLRFKLNILK